MPRSVEISCRRLLVLLCLGVRELWSGAHALLVAGLVLALPELLGELRLRGRGKAP